MKCKSCNKDLTPEEATVVVSIKTGSVSYVHRPNSNELCFGKVVRGATVETIRLVVDEVIPDKVGPIPYHCPVCPIASFYGKLLFEDEEPPFCPNSRVPVDGKVPDGYHTPVTLVPSV